MSFKGNHLVTLDDRWRVAVPARYRPELRENGGGKVVITISIMEKCLVVYPLPEWQRIESVLQTMPSTDPQVHAINHLLVGQATEYEMDGHGRILLPQPLRAFAGLVPDQKKPVPEHEEEDSSFRRIKMVGLTRKFELWREDRWEKHLAGLKEKVGTFPSGPQSVVGSLVL